MSKSTGTKGKKAKLLPHEQALIASQQLTETTHTGATSRWLHAPSTLPEAIPDNFTLVYRPMGDAEVLYLLEHDALPSTQPYQAIVQGPEGRTYAEKFLQGLKKVDTQPTTVVEFMVPIPLIEQLYEMQHKIEDGVISMGLGNKAGKGLGLFNQALSIPPASWRIVLVKRRGRQR